MEGGAQNLRKVVRKIEQDGTITRAMALSPDWGMLSPAQPSHEQAKNPSNSWYDMTLMHHGGFKKAAAAARGLKIARKGEYCVSRL